MKNLFLIIGGGLLVAYAIKSKKQSTPPINYYEEQAPGTVVHEGETYTEVPVQAPHSNNPLNWTFGGTGV